MWTPSPDASSRCGFPDSHTWKWRGSRRLCLAQRFGFAPSPWKDWSSSSTSVRRPRTTMATWFHVESVNTWMALPTQLIAGPDEHNTRSPVRNASILTSTVAGYLLRFGPHWSYGAARFDSAATIALCVLGSSFERTSPTTAMRCALDASIKSVAEARDEGSWSPCVGSGGGRAARTAAGGALGSFAGSIGLMALVGMQTTTIVLTAA
mmetsp:Transcript_3339/g.8147  ORF Transcript_3339/g.8147 Transcript_3339/m.8147 type:complete len:208 (-) Transcript_3339:147-770(-)